MVILETLLLIVVLVILLVVMLIPYLSIFLIGFCLVGLFSCIYYYKSPNLKMAADQEIPVEQVTFKPRNIIKELEERSL